MHKAESINFFFLINSCFTTMIWVLLLSLLSATQAIQIGNFEVLIDNGTLKSVFPLKDDKHLNLFGLELKEIAPDAFDNVTGITSLDLSKNRFNQLPESIFAKLADLEKLSLASNENLNYISDNETSLSQLKELDLSNSELSSAVKLFSNLPDDAVVKVPKKFYYLKPKMFSVNESMQVGPQDLTADNCTTLMSTSFYTNMKQNIGFSLIGSTVSSVSLCLNNGTIESVSDIENDSCESTYIFSSFLNLKESGIKSYNKNWYRLPSDYSSISMIRLEDNEITEVDENLLNDLPPSITTVGLVGNKIEALRNNTMRNDYVQTLGLGWNNIKTIENGTFLNLPSLRSLNLIHNNISDLYFVKSLSSTLEYLELSTNNISQIPDGIFSHLSNLYSLELSSNKIKTLSDKMFVGLERLGFLALNTNQIERLERGQLDNLRCVQNVNLAGNKLDFIEKGFAKNWNNVDVLILYTPIGVTKFERGLFYGLPSSAVVFAPPNLESFQPGLFKKY